MRVAIFTDNDFDKVNGVTTSLRAVLRHAPADIAPRIYTLAGFGVDRPDYLALASIGVGIPFYGEMKMYVPRLRALLRHARRDRIDLVHLTTPGPVGLAALFVAWRLGVRMVGTFHTDLAAYTALLSGSDRLGALMREYMRWPYGRCDRILAPSAATREMLIASKIDPRKIRLWTRGVDTTLFSPAKRTHALRDTWHVDERRPAIVYVGRVSREKGLDLLAPFQHALDRRGVQHRLIVVGDGPMAPALRRLCPDAVFTGVLRPAAVAGCVASSDLFIFPSPTDAAGNVVLESQACGTPVLVSDAGGPREYMVDEKTGVVCPAGDAEAFASAAAALLRDRERLRQMAQAARAHAESLGWHHALEPLYQAYRDVCEASRAAVAERPDSSSASPAAGNAAA